MAVQILYPNLSTSPSAFVNPGGVAWGTVDLPTGHFAVDTSAGFLPAGAGGLIGFPAHTGGGTPSSIKLKFNLTNWVLGTPDGLGTFMFGNTGTGPFDGNWIFDFVVDQRPDPTMPAFGVESGGAFEYELITLTNVPDNVVFGYKLAAVVAQHVFAEITNLRLEVTVPDPPLGMVRLHKPLYHGAPALIRSSEIDDEFNQIDSKLSGGTTGKQIQFTKNSTDPCLETVNSGGGAPVDMQQNSVSKFRILSPPELATDSITVDYLENQVKISKSLLMYYDGKTNAETVVNLPNWFINSDFILTDVKAMISARSTVVPPTCKQPDFNIILTVFVQKKDEDTVTSILTKTISATDFGDMSVPLVLWTGTLLHQFNTGDRIYMTYQQQHKPHDPVGCPLGDDITAEIYLKDLSINLIGYHFYKGSLDISDPGPSTT
jgi:hypothetical protein